MLGAFFLRPGVNVTATERIRQSEGPRMGPACKSRRKAAMIRLLTVAAVLIGISTVAHAGKIDNVAQHTNLPAAPGGGPHVRHDAGGEPYVYVDPGRNSVIESAGIKDFGTDWEHGNPDVSKTPSSGPVPAPYPQ